MGGSASALSLGFALADEDRGNRRNGEGSLTAALLQITIADPRSRSGWEKQAAG